MQYEFQLSEVPVFRLRKLKHFLKTSYNYSLFYEYYNNEFYMHTLDNVTCRMLQKQWSILNLYLCFSTKTW
jgi:hypothetical protein